MEPFLAEVRIVSFSFAPKGWALCNGQLMPINQNQALFALLGTTYGGDGRTNFALPSLQGRAVLGQGTRTLGERAGEENHTLTSSEMPAHAHNLNCSSQPGNLSAPTGNVFAREPRGVSAPYSPAADATMHPSAIGASGGSQPHLNMQPFLTLNFIIALQGIFPPRN